MYPNLTCACILHCSTFWSGLQFDFETCGSFLLLEKLSWELIGISCLLIFMIMLFVYYTRMPITVFMHDKDAGGLISIAEYGQEYGKDNPIKVLYDGVAHYDALLIPGKKINKKSRL